MRRIKYFLLLIIALFNSGLQAQNNNPQVDSIIQQFMNKWELPGGSFTMAYNRTILYSKGYGLADIVSMEPVTTQSLFRIASCSKPFTAVAIMQLIQHGQLSLNAKVFGAAGILNQPQYQNILDSNVLDITVQNLLEHTGGWDDNYQPDPMFMAVEIAEWANIPPPAMQPTIIQYVLSQMELINYPGTVYAYSNFGFCVLGRVIEKITGLTYETYVRENILIPSVAGTMQQGKNLLSGRYPNEVHYYGCPGEEITTSVYDTTEIVPWPYGGFNIEAMDSHGDWIASSRDLVNFLLAVHEDRLINQHSYNVMVTPPAVNPYYAKGWAVNGPTIFHQGSLPGTASEIVKAHNGYMWALVFNKRSLNDTIWTDLDNLGWNIIPFLPPPPVTDSCLVSGPIVVATDSNNTYSSAIPTDTWEVFSYNGAMASIVSAVNNNIVVNSGPTGGNYTVYKMGGDSNQLVLCSLNVSVDATLPVELESFTSNINGRNVILKWTTSSEQNNSGFDLERQDARGEIQDDWIRMKFIEGKGNSVSTNSYEFVDRNLSSGKYNYRLKQIDYNGNFQYHELAGEVSIGAPKEYSLSENYPNPFNPVTKINFDIPVSGIVKLSVFDASGREVQTLLNEFKEPGFYTVSFSAGYFASGVYFYRIETADFVMSRKMILLK